MLEPKLSRWKRIVLTPFYQDLRPGIRWTISIPEVWRYMLIDLPRWTSKSESTAWFTGRNFANSRRSRRARPVRETVKHDRAWQASFPWLGKFPGERMRVKGTRGTINPFKLQRRPSISGQLFPRTWTSLSFASLPLILVSNREIALSWISFPRLFQFRLQRVRYMALVGTLPATVHASSAIALHDSLRNIESTASRQSGHHTGWSYLELRHCYCSWWKMFRWEWNTLDFFILLYILK